MKAALIVIAKEQLGLEIVDGNAKGFQKTFLVDHEMFRWIGPEDGMREKIGPLALAPSDPLGGIAPSDEWHDVGIIGVQDDGEVKPSPAQGPHGEQDLFPFAMIGQELVEMGVVFEKADPFLVCHEGDVRLRIFFANGAQKRRRHDRVPDGGGADEKDAHGWHDVEFGGKFKV